MLTLAKNGQQFAQYCQAFKAHIRLAWRKNDFTADAKAHALLVNNDLNVITQSPCIKT